MNHRRLNTFRTILTNSLNIVSPITYGSKRLLSNIYMTMGHLSKEEITLYASFALQAFKKWTINDNKLVLTPTYANLYYTQLLAS